MDYDGDPGADYAGFPWEDYNDIPEEVLQQMMQQQDYYGGGGGGGGGGGMEYPYDQQDQPAFSYMDHFGNCVLPTFFQGVHIITPLVFGCLALRTVSFLGIPAVVYHLLSMTTGLVALSYFFENLIVQIVCLSLLGYFLLQMTEFANVSKGAITSISLVALLIIWELFVADPVEWNRIRGSQMMVVMKVISLAFDLDRKVVSNIPDLFEYLGYVCNLGTSIFGPWISYNSYIQALKPGNMDVKWFMMTFFTYFQSLICLLISTCITPIFFMEFDNKWLYAYKDAMSFRFSHYFVSFVSESTSIASGFGAPREGENRQLKVARPWHIELPRSMVQVVTNWNLPMHTWLKTYVFKTSRRFGNFAAILLTYVASSLLHGLNFQLAAVLLSLGFYSYVEHVLRQKLAVTFNACIQSKSCKLECAHVYQRTNPLVMLVNACFMILTIWHLAYLGVMFNSDTEMQEKGYEMKHTLQKWSDLDFASHYVAASTYIFYWLIK